MSDYTYRTIVTHILINIKTAEPARPGGHNSGMEKVFEQHENKMKATPHCTSTVGANA